MTRIRATAAVLLLLLLAFIVCRMKSLLYPLCVLAGLCYGSMFSLVLALTGDLFGAEHIGTNYGLLDLGTPCSRNSTAVSRHDLH